MMLQGWPAGWEDLLDRFSETVKLHLAGNAFTSTVTLSVLASLMCAMEWIRPATKENKKRTMLPNMNI